MERKKTKRLLGPSQTQPQIELHQRKRPSQQIMKELNLMIPRDRKAMEIMLQIATYPLHTSCNGNYAPPPIFCLTNTWN